MVRNYKVTSETNTPEINKAIESLRLDPVSADKSELVIKATAELEKTREKNVLALNESQREMNKNLVAMNCIVKNIKTSLPQSSPAVGARWICWRIKWKFYIKTYRALI